MRLENPRTSVSPDSTSGLGCTTTCTRKSVDCVRFCQLPVFCTRITDPCVLNVYVCKSKFSQRGASWGQFQLVGSRGWGWSETLVIRLTMNSMKIWRSRLFTNRNRETNYLIQVPYFFRVNIVIIVRGRCTQTSGLLYDRRLFPAVIEVICTFNVIDNKHGQWYLNLSGFIWITEDTSVFQD